MEIKRYKTQWAAQFYVAAELTRRGYLVSLTLGNAPTTDLLVISPNNKQFMIDVKGQSTKNFWIIRPRKEIENLFYVFAYLPRNLNERPKFFIMSSKEVMTERERYKKRILSKGGKYKEETGGMNWSTVLSHENKWEKLPA